MQSWIHSKPIEQITWADLESLITEGVTEGEQIEFKGKIPGNKGNPDPWAAGGRMADFGRDRILKELSAFLNSCGGTLFLGVEEEDEAPKRAKCLKPVPRAAELAARFEDVVRSVFVPPVASLAIRAVESPDGKAGEGIVIFRVQPSRLAPHGFNLPWTAYVRRNGSSVPMSRPDLETAFGQTKAEAEWVIKTRERFDLQRKKLMLENAEASSGQSTLDNPALSWPRPGVAFRISAIPKGRLSGVSLLSWREGVQARSLRPGAKMLGLGDYDLYRGGEPIGGWLLKGLGLWACEQDMGPNDYASIIEIEETGSVSFSSFLFGSNLEENHPLCVYHDSIYVPLAQVMFMVEIIRKSSSIGNFPFELDFKIVPCGTIHAYPEGRFAPWQLVPIFELSEVGPLVWSHREEMRSVFSEMQKQIAAACGMAVKKTKVPTFDEALAAREHHFIPKP